jgi:hypothetical protein
MSALPGFALLAWMVVFRGGSPVGGGVVWSPPDRKVELLLGYFIGYHPTLDALCMLLWLGAAGLAFRVETLSLKRLAWPVWGALAFLFLYAALPFELGTTSGVDVRMLPFLFVTTLAGLATAPRRRFAWAWVPLSTATLVRTTTVAFAWFGISKSIDLDLNALYALPPGSRVLVAKAGAMSKSQPTIHVPAWGVVAGKVTPSSLFAIYGQQPMVSEVPELVYAWNRASANGGEEIVFPASEATAPYEYIWLYNTDALPTSRTDGWERIYQRGEVDLWKRR